MGFISYARKIGTTVCHGSFSDLEGAPRVTWTLTEGLRKQRFERVLDADEFRRLWTFATLADVIQRRGVAEASATIDLSVNHMITIMAPEEGQRPSIYLVPVAEQDPGFLDWLQRLRMPTKGMPDAGTVSNPGSGPASAAPAGSTPAERRSRFRVVKP